MTRRVVNLTIVASLGVGGTALWNYAEGPSGSHSPVLAATLPHLSSNYDRTHYRYDATTTTTAVPPRPVVARASRGGGRTRVGVESAQADLTAAPTIDSILECIHQHEASDWHNRDTGHNGHFGGLQFAIATWQSVGGVGNPADATPEEQMLRGRILQARSGWGQWATHAKCGV